MLLFAVPLELVLLALGKELRAKFWAAEAAFWVEVDKFCARELFTRVAGVDKAGEELLCLDLLLGQLFLVWSTSTHASTYSRTLWRVLSRHTRGDNRPASAKPVGMAWVVPLTEGTKRSVSSNGVNVYRTK